MPSLSITISPGPRNNVAGSRNLVDSSDPVQGLARLLASSPASKESWWSVHTWENDRRSSSAWLCAAGVVADIDYVSSAGDHAMPSPEDAERFKSLASSLPGTHWHATPRGTRVIAVFAAPCSDPVFWAKAAEGFGVEIAGWLRRNRLDCDRDAHLPGYELDADIISDRARFMYGPRSLVSGIQRNAQIYTLRPGPADPAQLAKLAPADEPASAPKPAGPPVIHSATAFSRFEEAAEAYNREHARDWGRPGAGQCPACGHKGCFGRAKGEAGESGRWSCFSTNHVDGCGTRGDAVFSGDALDIDAYLNGASTADYLRSTGYLAERSEPSWEEPPPPTDAECPPDMRVVRGHLSLVPPGGFDSSEKPAKPVIRISTDEERVNDSAISALSRDDRIFQRGRSLVQVIRGINALNGLSRSPDALTIAEIPLARLRELLANAAVWEQVDAKAAAAAAEAEATGTDGSQQAEPAPKKRLKVKRTHPPDWTVKAVAARGRWEGIRPLTGVTEWPVLRADGTILADPGYDIATGLVYEPAGGVAPIPQEPSGEEVQASIDILRECVCDFPFADGIEGPSFSAWLAGLLTPLARYAFDGPAPLFLAEANTRGSGKTLLWELVAVILSGRPLPSTPYADKDEEMSKKITACALSGDPLIFLDNLKDRFGGGALDQALTGRSWRDRILGQSANTAELPLNAVWYATGNNLLYVGDIERRLCVCRLESPFENPEERDGFRHPDLLVWARQERRRIISAGLLLLRAFAVAGSPRGGWHPWGSYEGWSRTVKACVEWLGLPEPPAPRSAGTVTTELEELLVTLESLERLDPDGNGMTARDICHEVEAERDAAKRDARACDETILALVDSLGEALVGNSKKLGNRLRRWKGRVVRGRCLQVVGEDRLGSLRWAVKRSAAGWAQDLGAPDATAPVEDPDEPRDSRFPD